MWGKDGWFEGEEVGSTASDEAEVDVVRRAAPPPGLKSGPWEGEEDDEEDTEEGGKGKGLPREMR